LSSNGKTVIKAFDVHEVFIGCVVGFAGCKTMVLLARLYILILAVFNLIIINLTAVIIL